MPSKTKTSVRASAKRTNKSSTRTKLATIVLAEELGAKIRRAPKAAAARQPEADAPGPDPTAPEVPPAIDASATPPTLAHDAAEAKPGTKRGKGKPAAPAATPAKPAKAKREPKAPKPAKVKKVSCLDAAAIVLAEAAKPMKATEMIEAMTARGIWTPGAGKTPEASLYAAIIREIAAKGDEARFKKHDRGLFVAGKVA